MRGESFYEAQFIIGQILNRLLAIENSTMKLTNQLKAVYFVINTINSVIITLIRIQKISTITVTNNSNGFTRIARKICERITILTDLHKTKTITIKQIVFAKKKKT